MKFFGRPIRPENQHMPSTPMAGGSTTNPNHPPNAPQALPSTGLNVSIFFFSFYNYGCLVNVIFFSKFFVL
jgi:hypothetical protein